jgi:hypothetical protein
MHVAMSYYTKLNTYEHNGPARDETSHPLG